MIDPQNGMVISTLSFPSSAGLVGGTFNPVTETFFTANFGGPELVREVDPTTGNEIQRLLDNEGVDGFSLFFGGIDTVDDTGNLFVVGDRTPVLREITPSGDIVQDFDISAASCGAAGVSFNNSNGSLLISCTNGNIVRFDELTPIPTQIPLPTPLSMMLSFLGLGMLIRFFAIPS